MAINIFVSQVYALMRIPATPISPESNRPFLFTSFQTLPPNSIGNKELGIFEGCSEIV
jgi:hypothetical protein